jgi:hypothetical protein
MSFRISGFTGASRKIFDRLKKPSVRQRIFVGASVMLLLFSTLTFAFLNSGGQVHSRIVPAASCQAKVLFIGVRGSGEYGENTVTNPSDRSKISFHGHGVTVGYVLSSFMKAMGDIPVADDPVDYMAVSVPTVIAGAISERHELYGDSFNSGVSQLTNSLYYWDNKCPNYTFAIAGFSQGADVAATVLNKLDQNNPKEARILSKVIAVAVVADPRYNPGGDFRGINSNPKATKKGVLTYAPPWKPYGMRGKFKDNVAGKIRSYCRVADPVCQEPDECDPEWRWFKPKYDLIQCAEFIGLSAKQHTDFYEPEGYTTEAGRWLASRAKVFKAPAAAVPAQPIANQPTVTSPAPAPKQNTQAPVPSPAKPPIPAAPAPAAPPAQVQVPAPPASVNRQGITSYNRMSGGAPYHGFFYSAWQNFTAQSNTITYIGATVGSPGAAPGAHVGNTLNLRLCTTKDCTTVLAEANPQINNYGETGADIGNVAVTPGATYWVYWKQPAPINGQTWVTYWWAGGAGISQSDQMQAIVRGYNR